MSADVLAPIEVFEIATNDADRYARKQYVGRYLWNKMSFCWNVPAQFSFKVTGDHPLCPTFAQARRKVIPVRTYYNSREWSGRVMDVDVENEGTDSEIWTIYCMSNLFWIMCLLGWVNPWFPAEVQIGLTGKQDIMFGPFDWVSKWFLARNAARANIPVYCGLNVRFNNPGLPTLAQLTDVDELLSYVDGFDIVSMSSRFTYLNELFSNSVKNGKVGLDMQLVIPDEYITRGKPMPKVFNTSTLATLRSIIDFTSDNFLNLSKLNQITYLWNDTPPEPCYVYNSKALRDRRELVFQMRGGYVKKYKRHISHAKGSRVAVGGKAPAALNSLIEFAANLAIQAIAGAITAALGLAGIGSIAVGSLFDDIFFAFQYFFDNELRASLGRDGFAEQLANNTAAYSLDAFSVAMQKMREMSGEDSFEADVITGNEGYEFGADFDTYIVDGVEVQVPVAGRFDTGDIVNVYHRGTFVETWIAQVDIEHTPGSKPIETVVFGESRDKDMWASLFERIGEVGGLSRALSLSSG